MSSDEDLAYLGVAQAQALFRARKLSPVELVEALIRRTEALDPLIHAFVTTTPELALVRAREAEQRFMRGDADAFTGIPYGLKDIIETAGVLTTGQSRILEHHVPQHDAELERRIKAAGGVLLGKLTTYELAHGGPSWDLPWPPAMTPWKKGRRRVGGRFSSGCDRKRHWRIDPHASRHLRRGRRQADFRYRQPQGCPAQHPVFRYLWSNGPFCRGRRTAAQCHRRA